jgi:glycerate kinase
MENQPAIIGLADVINPLLGPSGASRVYGPQKGASPADAEILESALARVAAIARRDLGIADSAAPGAGAAGGLGYGLMVFLGASVQLGFDAVAEATALPAAIAAADLVLTGEGRLDAQTLAGKAPVGVARRARAAGRRVIALAGSVAVNQNTNQEFDAVVPITAGPMTLDEAMRDAGILLETAAERTARLLRLGKTL